MRELGGGGGHIQELFINFLLRHCDRLGGIVILFAFYELHYCNAVFNYGDILVCRGGKSVIV